MASEEDLIAWKWAESLSTGEQSVLLNSSIKRLQSTIATALSNTRAEQREVDAKQAEKEANKHREWRETDNDRQYQSHESYAADTADEIAAAIRAGLETAQEECSST